MSNIYYDGSSEEEIDEGHIELFSKLTRNCSTYDRIMKRIEDIMQKPSNDENQHELCIIGCERKWNTALLSCRHQPICDKCWFIWSTKSMQRQNPSFEEDILPKCPICREPVEENIPLFVQVNAIQKFKNFCELRVARKNPNKIKQMSKIV